VGAHGLGAIDLFNCRARISDWKKQFWVYGETCCAITPIHENLQANASSDDVAGKTTPRVKMVSQIAWIIKGYRAQKLSNFVDSLPRGAPRFKKPWDLTSDRSKH
jgi:hypothetical protein